MPRKFMGREKLTGRGALSNPAGRFELDRPEEFDDGWYREGPVESVLQAFAPDRARAIITSNDSPDVGFEYSINPYRGCEHGCIYCFARPSHAYLGLSSGLDFETRIFFKENAAQLLEAELSKPKYVPKPIALGINTDAYQPLEKKLEVTRDVLKVLKRARHPVSLLTKSALILRDIDLIAEMAQDNLIKVALSITSLSAEIKRTLEPRTASPQARLRALQELAKAGIPTGIMVAPVIPAITDHEMENILEAGARAGATSAGYVLLRLPYEVKDLFREWLAAHYPDRARHVMSLIHQARDGRDNDPNFGSRMRGTGPYAEILRKRFEVASRNLGLTQRHALDCSRFSAPQRASPQTTFDF